MLAIYDSYLSHERPKTRPKVELLAQKGAFSRFYSLVKAKSRVGKAIELIEAVIGKITGKIGKALELVETLIQKFIGEPSTPSPIATTSKIRQSQQRSGRLKI